MTLFDGITSRIVDTDRLTVNILERAGDDPQTPPDRTVVFVHGNVSSALFWQEIVQDLPSDLRAIAVDLRGFGGSEHAPVDATRGVRDFSDDLHATLEALDIPSGDPVPAPRRARVPDADHALYRPRADEAIRVTRAVPPARPIDAPDAAVVRPRTARRARIRGVILAAAVLVVVAGATITLFLLMG